MKTYYKLIAIIVCIFQFLILNYQFLIGQNILDYRNTIFHKLNTQNGLPDNIVTCVVQDKTGFIWIGTANGLVRYDGINFKVYQNIPSDSTSLTSNTIRNIIIVQNNIFYLVTNVGLVKFYPEIEKFEHLHTQKNPELFKRKTNSNNSILDKKQRIWIELDLELIVYDTRLERVSAVINNTKYGKFGWHNEDKIFHIEDKDGYLWFTDPNNGFYRVELKDTTVAIKNYNKNFNRDIKIPINANNVHKDSRGNIYLSNNGLFMLPNNKKNTDEFEQIDLFKGKLPKDNMDFKILSIVEDDANNLWIATDNYGLKKYNLQTKEVEHLNFFTINYKGIKTNRAIFFKDKNNAIWAVFQNNVIVKYNNNTRQFTEYKHNPTDPNSPDKDYFAENMSKLRYFQDNSGVYWFATLSGGITFFDPAKAKFPVYKELPNANAGLSGNKAWGIYEDNHNYLWLGIQNSGLNILNLQNGSINYYKPDMNKDYSGLHSIMSIAQITENEFWLGSVPLKRVNYDYKAQKLKYIDEFKPLFSDTAAYHSWTTIYVFKDSRNNIFTGTIGFGMEQYMKPDKEHPNGYFKHFPHNANNPNGIAGAKVWHIMEDTQNRLWISTGGGISIMNKERDAFTNHFANANKSNQSVKMCFQDKKGRFWIATESGGLNQFIENENRFVTYNKKNGFPSDNIYAVYDDKSGNLWMSSNAGIIRFNPDTKETIVFTTDDGLQGIQFLVGAFHKGKSGKIYFGGNDGINHFYPDSIKLSAYVPKLVFTSLKISGNEIFANKTYNGKIFLTKELSYLKEITLSYRENMFSIEFAALDYSASKNIKYTYQIEGLSNDWVKVDAQDRKISFTNLSPGKYTIKVKSTNSDGVWCENMRTLKLTITPPFWQTWWFRTITLFLIVSSSIAYYKYKTYEIKRKNQELERKVAERTHEVMQQKEEIQQQAEELEATNEELTAQSDALKMSNEELNLKNDELNQKNDEIEKSFKISQVISEFGQRVTSTFDLESINEIVYGYLYSIMPTDAFGIGLYKEDKNEIEYIGFIEEGQKIDNFTKKLDSENSLTAWCFNNQKVLFVNDLETEYSKYISSLPNVSTNKQPQSIIHLPLSVNEKRLGIIVVNSFHKNAYTNKDLVHLQSLASYITIAIDNANAYKTVNAQKEKLQELDNFKEAMTGMIVHDLKNPLNAIIGLSSMNPEDEMMQMINSAGNQMLNLVLNILDVQKFENTEVKLNLNEASLYELAEEANRQVTLLIKQKKQILNINILPQTIISTDSEVTIRVFVNMLTNAIKYTPNGGSISINQEAILFNEDDYNKSDLIPDTIKTKFKFQTPICLISVSDTGQGIPADKLHLVFEKFGQVEAKKSGGVRSTGLGMTFCKMVVEAHGGAIWITSEVGKGTNFYFTLPFARNNESIQIENLVVTKNIEEIKKSLYDICLVHENGSSEIIAESGVASLEKELKILVADDDKYSIDVIKNCLSTWGKTFLIYAVGNGIEAVDAAKIIVPDIILLDWEMPQLDGLEALKQIKSIPELSKIPVAMVTSRSGNSHIQLAFDAGAADYIKKPIDKTEALFRVQTLANLSELIKTKAPNNRIDLTENSDSALVLVVDDVYEIRQMVKQVLQNNYLIIEAENGTEGITKAKELLPDIIISDINMPELNGLQLCKEIKSSIATNHIPIILLTAQAGMPSNIAGLEAGADAYLTKPIMADLLLAAVKNQIENRETLRKAFSRIITSEPSDVEFTTADEKFISQCIKTVEENISNSEFHLESFVKEMSMSYGQLYGKIKFLTNLSVAGFIRDIRLKRAKQILGKEKLTVKELMIRVGFENNISFIRMFKNAFGMTPTEYAKLMHS